MFQYIIATMLTMVLAKTIKPKFCNSKHKILLSFLCVIPLILVAGLRYDVGTDYMSYYSAYNKVYNNINASYPEYLEVGYILLMRIFSFFRIPYVYFFIFCETIILLPITYFVLENSPSPMLSMFLLVWGSFYFASLNVMRTYMASSILICSIRFIERRKFIPFILICLFAYSIHNSSLVFVIVYFVGKKRFKLKDYLFFTIAFIMFSSFFIYIINRVSPYLGYERYLLSDSHLSSTYYYLFINILVLLFCYFFYDENNKYFTILLNLQFINIFVSIYSYEISLFSRLRHYFSYTSIVLIALSINKVKFKERKHKILIYIIIALLFFVYTYHSISNGNHDVLPYRSIFNR